MSRVHEALNTGRSEDDWRIITPDDATIGPLSTVQLMAMAADGRLVPGCRVSSGGQAWQRVEDIPELRLEWVACHQDAPSYGPFHVLAVPHLVRQGVLNAETVLQHVKTGKTIRVDELLKNPAGSSPAGIVFGTSPDQQQWLRREAELEQQLDELIRQRDELQRLVDESSLETEADAAAAAERIKALNHENEQWRERLNEQHATVKTLEQRLVETEDRRLAREKQALLTERKLNGELQTLRELLENTRRKQDQTARDAENRLLESEKKIKQLENLIEEQRQESELRAHALEQDVAGRVNENSLLSEELDSLRSENEELRRQNLEIETGIQERLQSGERELEALRAAAEDAGREEWEKEKSALLAEIAALQAGLREDEAQHTGEVSSLREAQKSLQAEVEELRVQAAKAENAETLNKEVTELHEANRALQAQIESAEQKYSSVAQQADVRLKETVAERDRLQAEVTRLQADFDNLKRADTQEQREAESYKAQLEAAREQQAEIAVELSRAREQAARVASAASEQHEKEIRSLRGELARQRSRNKELETALESGRRQTAEISAQLASEKNAHTGDNQSAAERIAVLQQELAGMREQRDNAQREITRIQEIREALDGELEKTRNELDRLRETTDRLEGELRNAQIENKRIRREHETALPGAMELKTSSQGEHAEPSVIRLVGLMAAATLAVIVLLWVNTPVGYDLRTGRKTMPDAGFHQLPQPPDEPLRAPEYIVSPPQPETAVAVKPPAVPEITLPGAISAAFDDMLRISFNAPLLGEGLDPAPAMLRRLFELSEAVGPWLDSHRLYVIARSQPQEVDSAAREQDRQRAQHLAGILISNFALPAGRIAAGADGDFAAPQDTAAHPAGIEFWLIPVR